LLDALHGELIAAKTVAPAMRLEALVTNPEHFCAKPEDRFKVWPTNRDRPAFNAVMGAHPPVNHDAVGAKGERMVEAHRFFAEQARHWLVADGNGSVATRAAAIETTVRELLQMVVIDLAAEENAQEIFETLNARGAQLTAADLIKNFVFQRLLDTGADVERAYQQHWHEFETGFWETEVSVGRLRYPRSSIFLNHWLIARTGDEVVAREVFARFKSFAEFEAGVAMDALLPQIHAAADVYRRFVTEAESNAATLDRVALFGYRTGVLESEVVKPLILRLLDPEEPPLQAAQLAKALDAVESWMVRRMLVRATTKNYNQVISELVTLLAGTARLDAGDVVTTYLAKQQSESRYWPDDEELRDELPGLPAYRRLGRSRLRMVLEAIEDYKRGFTAGGVGLGGERVARGKFAIEHVMPRKWTAYWPAPAAETDVAERERLIHTLGNLTLLTGPLNSKVSNGAWPGVGGKREALEAHDVLFLNREIRKGTDSAWSDDMIRERARALVECILRIWPVPPGHQSSRVREKVKPTFMKVQLVDLINAGMIVAGASLFRRGKHHTIPVATVLSDGRIDMDGQFFGGPSQAATAIVGHRRNGWAFFVVDKATRRSLRRIRTEYLEQLAGEIDTDDGEEGADEDDEA
jgi:hypothetical protein